MAQATRGTANGPRRGSGGSKHAPEPRYLAVGRVLCAHGIGGELKVAILTDDPDRFGLLKRVYIGREDEPPVPHVLEGYRLHSKYALLQIRGCQDRDAAQALRDSLILIPEEEALPLGEDEFYEYQIVDLEVFTRSGGPLGRVVEILHTGANDVYVVRSSEPQRRDVLIPAIEGVIVEVDLGAGRMTVDLPDGLM